MNLVPFLLGLALGAVTVFLGVPLWLSHRSKLQPTDAQKDLLLRVRRALDAATALARQFGDDVTASRCQVLRGVPPERVLGTWAELVTWYTALNKLPRLGMLTPEEREQRRALQVELWRAIEDAETLVLSVQYRVTT